MNGVQKGKHPNIEKPFPGCLGRMVNLFDLGTVAKNKLLTDKPHYEGSPLSRSQSDVSRTTLSADKFEEKVFVSEFRTSSNDKPNGTPIKTLIDQEMSKEIDSPNNSPSVVAKLMGLDALPQKLPDIAAQRGQFAGYSRSRSASPSSYSREDRFLEAELQHECDRRRGQKDYKDIYEIWQQAHRTNFVRERSPNKEKYDYIIGDKKMDLVRRKFMEAKRMATDGKLRQSKQFQEALEVLSSNKDSFLKFLQEPNSLFSQHVYNTESIPPTPETKRITVLRPSKMVDSSRSPGKNDESKMKRISQVNALDKTIAGFSPPAASRKADDNPTQPTRIVVLKPSTGKHDIHAMGFAISASPRTPREGELFKELEHNVAQESRKVAKTIPQFMRENLDRRAETLPSSVFSNGYKGDESSFNKSENEYAPGNLSDSDVMSPASRHSWDCVNRFDSPYSSSSFGRASYSPESAVCREAKKRLSERWSVMASNGSIQEPKHVRRSSTLGEMLALSDIKKAGRSEDECADREEPEASSAFLNNNLRKYDAMDSSPRNLMRSKSVPASSTEFGPRLSVDIPDPEGVKSAVPQDPTKARSSRSSFRGKVSSLFFSRNKRTSQERSSASQSKEASFCGGTYSPGYRNNGTEHVDGSGMKSSSLDLPTSSSQASSATLINKQRVTYPEAGFLLEKPLPSKNTGVELLAYPSKSNLIDKSPPIGSIARTLLCEDSCADTASSRLTVFPTQGVEEEAEEWLFYIQTLLSVAGHDGLVQSFISRWHSPGSPLDPSLRDKYIDWNDKEIVQEAKRRQRRSMQKLVFDCVNAAMIDIAGYGPDTCQRAIPNGMSCNNLLDSTSFKMVDQVWARIKEWFSADMGWVLVDDGDIISVVVDTVVRKEVGGKGWDEYLRLEVDNLGKELEQELLEELLQDSLIELTGRR